MPRKIIIPYSHTNLQKKIQIPSKDERGEKHAAPKKQRTAQPARRAKRQPSRETRDRRRNAFSPPSSLLSVASFQFQMQISAGAARRSRELATPRRISHPICVSQSPPLRARHLAYLSAQPPKKTRALLSLLTLPYTYATLETCRSPFYFTGKNIPHMRQNRKRLILENRVNNNCPAGDLCMPRGRALKRRYSPRRRRRRRL